MTATQYEEKEAVTTYSMHVSAKYLELTKKKLELTRLPREVELPEQRTWEQGTPKSALEPLLDFWLDGYDWRAAEAKFNLDLPQYRTTITTPSTSSLPTPQILRIHFVHKRSKHENAIPLLFCHTWPSSFIEVQRVIDALTDPHSLPSFGDGAQQAFHVIAPSIPGFGFSDASMSEDFGLNGTAEVFDGLMARLGYDRYVAHGTGCICRALALQHPEHCLAVHTANPSFTEPAFKRGPLAYMKYRIAKMTKAKIPLLSFGYVPTELQASRERQASEVGQESLYSSRPLGPTLHRLYSLRPQTLAFSLCDSPVGLLATLLDVIHTRAPSHSPLTSRSRSPFLSPVELEMRDDEHEHPERDRIHSGSTEYPFSPRQSEIDAHNYTWSPTEVLNFTMLQWLPGPEAALRWLRRAHLESTDTQWSRHCSIPLGISSFHARNSSRTTPLMWGSSSWDISWVKRHQRPSHIPAWEAPDLVVLDLRECFGTFLSHGKLTNLPSAAS
ncbi:alpha/beta-hydrolase [Cucurbitaria berberidis CBS 394.84]|uniref:Alpha/beta-hydrolase n=1 Tax=Cucurbitaria berberidis CBS 394.84 TaxID=1168544 RepID=A0A9P4GKE9_9PLEO|nr:alpha/beta-hydrolase [Cucurbitaria berberidis CBS 394.84]KAF1847948.1 alpha/beta-hydrolase [Cucurbitaria berberidis CBS 394.84]